MRKAIVGAVIICIPVFLGIVVLAWTASGQEVRPTAANSCLGIPACAFQEDTYTTEFFSGPTLYNSSGGASYFAPVNLPEGATVKKIQLICFDNNSNKNIKLCFTRKNRENIGYEIATLTSTGRVAGWRTFSTTVISPRTINNFKNSYYVDVELPGSDGDGFELSQVKILYDAP